MLYEFEACPWCRVAREAISEAGLSVIVRPCPKGGQRFRPDVEQMGGKSQFPYWLQDENAVGMYESSVIAKLMRERYNAPRPVLHWLGPINGILSSYASILRLGFGRNARPAKPQVGPLEFYGSEANPSARLVKEALCSLELEYIWHPGEGSRVRLFDRALGNTINGGRAILKHLKTHHTA